VFININSVIFLTAKDNLAIELKIVQQAIQNIDARLCGVRELSALKFDKIAKSGNTGVSLRRLRSLRHQ